jgi:hypothetical protein
MGKNNNISIIGVLIVLFSVFCSGNLAVATITGDNIIISEVEYDPIQGGIDNKYEWFELFNPTGVSMDISNWTIKEGAAPIYTFPALTTISSGGYLLVANDTAFFQTEHPGVVPDLEMDPGGGGLLKLNNGGDELTLKDGGGITVDYVAWENFAVGWGTTANHGESICRSTSTDSDTAAD